MSLVIKANLKISDLPKEKLFEGKKGTYLPVVIVVNKDLNTFDKQGPIFIEQSKEERMERADKSYLGDCTVVFNDLSEIKTTKDLIEDKQ